MEKLFELTFQDQTLSPQVGTFTDTSQTTGTFTLEDGEYYLTNGDTKGFYAYSPVAMQSGLVDDSKVIIEFDLKVVTASVNTHTIIGTYAGVDGNGIPTGAKITLQYNAGDIELVLGSGTTETLIESADIVVDQWYHFRIDCALTAAIESTYGVKIDGTEVATVTGATTDYELGIISVLGTDLHACDECGIKNITLVTETNLYVGRTALDQALQDVKGYVDSHCVNLTGSQTVGGNKNFTGTTNIQSLTINGTAAGDILTHNASEFVDVSGNQTIGGNKTWSDSNILAKNVLLANITSATDNTISFNALHSTVFFNTRGSVSYKSYGTFLYAGYLTETLPNRYGILQLLRSTDKYGDASDGRIPDTSFKMWSVSPHYLFMDFMENLRVQNDGSVNVVCPITDSATDLGTSTNKWKDVNTVLLNGKTPAYSTDIPTKVSQLTNDSGFITSEIDSMGTGWVRFKSGLQICYGGVANNNNLGTGIARFSFPKAFSANPSLVVSPNDSGKWVNTCVVEGASTWVLYTFGAWMSPIELNGGGLPVSYMAIGKWN